MPKSKVRKKTAYTPPADRRTPVKVRAAGPTGLAWKIPMFGLMILGLVWLLVNYIAGDKISWMADLGNWNFMRRVRADDRGSADDDALALIITPNGGLTPNYTGVTHPQCG